MRTSANISANISARLAERGQLEQRRLERADVDLHLLRAHLTDPARARQSDESLRLLPSVERADQPR